MSSRELLAWPGPVDKKPPFWEEVSDAKKRSIIRRYGPIFDRARQKREHQREEQERQREEQERQRQEREAAARREREQWRAKYPLFLRFGKPPVSGRSTKYIGGQEELGISCFYARRSSEAGGYEVMLPRTSWAVMYSILDATRPAFLLEGTELETVGFMGEPLLRDLTRVVPLPKGTRVLSSYSNPEPLLELVQAVLERSTGSSLHGESHSMRVALTGLELCRDVPQAEPLVVVLFALFHDAMRSTDGHDPEHGKRAAALAKELLKGKALLHAEQVEKLIYGIERHDRGLLSEDATTAVCWDADRLNLWRIGRRPDAALLSTEAAKQRIAWARTLQAEPVGWDDVFKRYRKEALVGHKA